MDIFRSIKTRLLVFILCISLIPIAAISTIYYLNARKALKAHTLTWMKEIAEARRSHVLAFMDSKKGRTVDFSSDGFIRDSLEKINNNEEKQETAINLSRHLSVNKKPLDPYIISIAVVNLRGKVIASTDKKWIGEDISNREVFTPTVKGKSRSRAYVGRPHYIPEFDKKCIFIHARLTSKDSGKPIGLIFNVFDLAILSNITAGRTSMSKTGEVYIVDSNKMMITESRFIENAPLEVMVDTEPVRKAITSGEEMIGIYTDYRGVPIVGASVYIPENGWTLLSEIDKSEAFAPLRFLGIVALSVGLISAALTSVLGVFFAVSTSKPIKLLTGAAEKFADGNLDYRAKINQKDEIGQLAQSFNTMAENLQKRTEELSRSNKELDDFAYTASHDLKEPLRGIHNFSSFLIEDYEDKLDDEGKHKLHTLMKLSKHLEELINNLLYYSRIGRTQEAFMETDLNHIVEEVKEVLGIIIEEQGIDMRIPVSLPSVYCDKTRIKDIFSNLITNSIKYNDKEGKWIEIGYMKDKHQGGYTFYVRDNGIGIKEKYTETIFGIFKRLHERDEYGGGTGAGLAIAKKIVEFHGGKVWVESTPGQGTTFYFTLGAI